MFKKTIFLAIFSVLLILPLSNANAQSINISLNQQTFKSGEKIETKVSFTNPTQQQLKGQLICSFDPLNPDPLFAPMPFMEEFNLAPREKSKTFTFEMAISNWMPEGLWKAEVEIRDERDNLITKNYKELVVTGTKKSIEANVAVCANKDCNERKVVFIKGETVYLKLDTLIQDLNIDATIKIPSGKIEKITFENNLASYSLKDADEGAYSLWVNLSKDGYRNQKITKDFAVLNKPAEILSASVCNSDGKCENGENIQNCPQDCLPRPKTEENRISPIILIGSVITVIAIITLIIFYFKKTKDNSTL